MSTLALCADFISSGQVLGQGLHSNPDAWDHALGDPDWPLVDVRRNLMRRDYGMIEVGFERHGADWTCVYASIQVHRLGGDLEQLVGERRRVVEDSGHDRNGTQRVGRRKPADR